MLPDPEACATEAPSEEYFCAMLFPASSPGAPPEACQEPLADELGRSPQSTTSPGSECGSPPIAHEPQSTTEEPAAAIPYTDEDDPEVTNFYRLLLQEAVCIPGNDMDSSLDALPSWVDVEKLRLGQEFAQKFFFGLAFAEVLSLFMLFASQGAVAPIIFSGKSDTPYKAFRRYLSTASRVYSWYSGEMCHGDGEARRHIRAVRALHCQNRRALAASSSDERQKLSGLVGPLWTTGAAHALSADIAEHNARHPDAEWRFAKLLNPAYLRTTRPGYKWINQAEMSLTQFGFVSLTILYPRAFGAAAATEEQLDAFVHLWRVIGHLLGVDERFNFCAGGLAATRARARLLVRRFMMPNLVVADEQWEHMTRCVIEGISYYVGMTYEVALLYLCETVGVKVPRVAATLTLGQWFTYHLSNFLLRFAMLFEPVRDFLNWSVQLAMKRARESPPPPRDYPHERAGPSCPFAR